MNLINIITGVADISLVTLFVFWLLKLFSGSRAIQLFAGIASLAILYLLSKVLNLTTIEWMLEKSLPGVFIVMVVVFQPEIRRTLERIGRNLWLAKVLIEGGSKKDVVSLNKVINAVEYFSKNKIGALIAIEQLEGLEDFIESGLRLDSLISEDLLISIFNTSSPLHDGAVILRGERIEAARVIFPLTKSNFIDQRLGTRHKAAIGLAEISDAIVIVVSENSGIISLAEDGVLVRYMSRESLEEKLLTLFQKGKRKLSIINWVKGKN